MSLKILEKHVEKQILEYLNRLPDCFAWKNQSVGVFDPSKGVFRKSRNKFAINGTSDIIGIYKGKMICIEVKSPSNKKRPDHQADFLDQITKRGGVAFFADSIEVLKANLEMHLNTQLKSSAV